MYAADSAQERQRGVMLNQEKLVGYGDKNTAINEAQLTNKHNLFFKTAHMLEPPTWGRRRRYRNQTGATYSAQSADRLFLGTPRENQGALLKPQAVMFSSVRI